MSKRTVFLCASFGTLVLSAAHVPATLNPSSGPSGAQAHTPLSEQAQRTTPSAPSEAAPPEAAPPEAAPSEAPSLEQLRAAYAPNSTGAPNSDRASSSARTSRSAPPSAPNRASNALAPPLEVEAPTLWLARAIYSETKLPHEQELVAWVIRNRVETGYRGKSTYRDVVLDPYQFSAFNPGSSKRSFLMRLGPETPLPRWRQALWVARYVRHAAPVYRPFSIETRHFYSERSMEGRAVPYWADRAGIVPPDRRRYDVEERRFRFFEQVS
jgi:hypothetical protein